MKRFRRIKTKKNTMKNLIFVVFFCVIINSILLFSFYSKKISEKSIILIEEKTNKIIYQFFMDLITDEIINNDSTKDILLINKNSSDEIVSVDYNLEKTYKLLTDTSKIIKNSLYDLENGKIKVEEYDRYLETGKKGLILNAGTVRSRLSRCRKRLKETLTDNGGNNYG